MYVVETLRSTVGQMQDRQNKLVTQMESLTTDTAKLAKNFKKLQGAVDMMKNLEVSTSHFLRIEIAKQQVAVMAERYFSGLSSLMDGKLNVDMANIVPNRFLSRQLVLGVFRKWHNHHICSGNRWIACHCLLLGQGALREKKSSPTARHALSFFQTTCFGHVLQISFWRP